VSIEDVYTIPLSKGLGNVIWVSQNNYTTNIGLKQWNELPPKRPQFSGTRVLKSKEFVAFDFALEETECPFLESVLEKVRHVGLCQRGQALKTHVEALEHLLVKRDDIKILPVPPRIINPCTH
jgi:hypothetical protein